MIASGRSVSAGERRRARSGLAAVQRDCRLDKRRCRWEVAVALRSTPVCCGTLGEALLGLGEGGGDAAVAFGVRDMTVKGIDAREPGR